VIAPDLFILPATQATDRIYGVVIGVVTNNEDPDKLGRVKVQYPWLSDKVESNWARVVTPMAGNERGFFALPEVDDEVLIAFAHGDVRFPYVLGSLWNGKDKPPAEDKESVVLNAARKTITITADKDVVIESKNGSVTLKAKTGIEIAAPDGKVVVKGKEIDLN
jgi:uncharacterized protein involved in type VI secretion and phage assembly